MGGKHFDEAVGYCYSACTLSFLGGAFRYLENGKYGVHRFFALPGSAIDSDAAQVMSASVLQYIRDMGVDPDFFSEMTKAGQSEINILSEERLINLGVVNNGVGNTEWTFETIETAEGSSLYFRGVRDTVYGMQKITFTCAGHGEILADVIFDPKGNADKIVKMTAISFVVNTHQKKINSLGRESKPFLLNGWINIIFGLSKETVSELRSAQSIGTYAQFSYDAPTFFGIHDMDFRGATRKFGGFLSSCH